MREIIDSELFILLLNVSAFIFGKYVIDKTGIKFIPSLIVAIAVVSSIIYLLEIDYATYSKGSRVLNYMLSPSVVALGYLLHKNIDKIKLYIIPITVSVTLGALVNLVVVNIILSLFEVDIQTIYALQPKSVTTPIAISLVSGIGLEDSIPLTIMSVVSTGVFGSIVGVPIMRVLNIKSPIAIGAAFGSSAHAIGTSMALEIGALEGAVAGFTIALTGVITAFLLPIISNLFL